MIGPSKLVGDVRVVMTRFGLRAGWTCIVCFVRHTELEAQVTGSVTSVTPQEGLLNRGPYRSLHPFI
jgi:hypothetical protein